MNPDYAKPGISREEYTKNIDTMMTKLTSNLPALKVWAEYARLNVAAQSLPKLLKEANQRGQTMVNQNKDARTGAPRKQKLNYKTGNSKGNNSTLNYLKGAGYDI